MSWDVDPTISKAVEIRDGLVANRRILVGAVIAVQIVAVANVLVRYTAQTSRDQPKHPEHEPVTDDPDPGQTPAG